MLYIVIILVFLLLLLLLLSLLLLLLWYSVFKQSVLSVPTTIHSAEIINKSIFFWNRETFFIVLKLFCWEWVDFFMQLFNWICYSGVPHRISSIIMKKSTVHYTAMPSWKRFLFVFIIHVIPGDIAGWKIIRGKFWRAFLEFVRAIYARSFFGLAGRKCLVIW